MKIEELRASINALRDLLEVAGTKPTTIDGLDEFVALLDDRREKTVADLILELEAAANRTSVNEPVVAAHLKALEQAANSRAAFMTAFAALKADRAVGIAEADLIFRRYHGRADWQAVYGDKPRWHKRAEALKAIETSFNERMTQQQKLEQVAKSTPW